MTTMLRLGVVAGCMLSGRRGGLSRIAQVQAFADMDFVVRIGDLADYFHLITLPVAHGLQAA
jgi:hypothetical protein